MPTTAPTQKHTTRTRPYSKSLNTQHKTGGREALRCTKQNSTIRARTQAPHVAGPSVGGVGQHLGGDVGGGPDRTRVQVHPALHQRQSEVADDQVCVGGLALQQAVFRLQVPVCSAYAGWETGEGDWGFGDTTSSDSNASSSSWTTSLSGRQHPYRKRMGVSRA
jgi:hypothetical protein